MTYPENAPVDLTNCDREPIHIPGSIQPHGAMLVCDPEGRIAHASANAAQFLGRDGADLIEMSIADLLGGDTAHDLRNAAMRSGGSHVAGLLLSVVLPGVAQPLDIAVHSHKDRMFVEFERSGEEPRSAQDALDLTQSLVRRIGLESDVKAIATTGAKLARALLGYDRVMVYQFLHNGAGQVIAEAKRGDMSSFMGQRFPAADIPFQARRLYLANPIRIICDVTYAPVPVLPPVTSNVEPIDMSFAQLRSVSPIHCEYLQNMGVAATLSISIVVNGELWGLIACHHDSAKTVPMPLRVGAELFGQYFSLQIAVAERRAEVIAATAAREKLAEIVNEPDLDETIAETLTRNLEALRGVLGADGAGLWIDGDWKADGIAPSEDELDGLMALVGRATSGTIWCTGELGELMGPGAGFGGAVAGMMAIPISSLPRDYLLMFRSEEAHKIEWAGEPVKHIVSTPQGDRLTPRGSFETWREDVRGKSRPWSQAEIAVAETMRTYLRDVVLRHSEVTADERTRTDQRRRVLNDELNHRVKNIIALVKSIALQTGAHAATVQDYSTSLEGRLRALAFAHDQSLGGSSGELTTLIEAEASLHRYGAIPDRVMVEGPAVGLDDRTFGVLALVVHEMMTNAAKYGALSVPAGQLKIGWSIGEAGDCTIDWQEIGGPAVSEPSRTGFGSKLVHSTIAYDLRGTAEIAYETSGVRARFVIPAMHLTEIDATRPTAASADARTVFLEGLDILLVEDQALIAMDTEETLMRLGARRVRSLPSAAEALDAIAIACPDCAVLDFNLGEETSSGIADALVTRGVPFIFATGYGDSVMIPERFGAIPVVRKPVSATVLADKLDWARTRAGADAA